MFGFLERIFDSFSCNMAIDLGTANTLVHIKGKGIVLNEPSVVTVAYDGVNKNVVAIGHEAKEMIGRTPSNTKAIRPLRDGVIADFEIAAVLIKHFIKKATQRKSFFMTRPKMVICVPSGATQVERRAIKEAAESAGAGAVFLIQEPMAAALGAGLPVMQPIGSMVIDIGGGTAEIAIISLGGIVYAESLRVGGDMMDEAIINYIRRNHSLLIGHSTAENIKITVGSAVKPPKGDDRTISVKGRDLINGIPKEVIVSESQISDALSGVVNSIVAALRAAMEYVDPELAADIVDRGIVLAGGGALLKGLSQAIENSAKLPVIIAEDPKACVVMGTGLCLEDAEKYWRLLEMEK